MGILSELLSDISSNRPRLLNFRNEKKTAAPGQTSKPESVKFREYGQYPIIHPEFENVFDPHEWHEKMVNESDAEKRQYLNDMTQQSVYSKFSNETSDVPASVGGAEPIKASQKYHKDAVFR